MRIFVATPLRRGNADFRQRGNGALPRFLAIGGEMRAIGFADLLTDG